MSYCDFIAGWAGGVLGLVTGHPFETVKVNQQTKGIGVIECVRRIHGTHGTKGFFRGLGFPLVANGTLNSIFFGVYGHTVEALLRVQNVDKAYLQRRSASTLPRTGAPSVARKKAKVENPQATYMHCLIGGCVAGVAQLTVACPVEVVKIKLQTASREHRRRGPLAILTNILESQGPRGLYQGLKIMSFRDVPSFGVYMLLYTSLSDGLKNWHIFANQEGSPNSLRALVAGGLAGTVSWWTIIPLDVIKSRMQADDPTTPKYRSISHCAQKIFKAQGYAGFFKGFWPMSIRAFAVNGATFLAYEWIDWMCLSLSSAGDGSE